MEEYKFVLIKIREGTTIHVKLRKSYMTVLSNILV